MRMAQPSHAVNVPRRERGERERGERAEGGRRERSPRNGEGQERNAAPWTLRTHRPWHRCPTWT